MQSSSIQPDSGQSLNALSLGQLRNSLLILGGDEVDVWQACLTEDFEPLVKRSLSADEQQRAERFRFPKDRLHFTVARGLLRAILASYLDSSPEDIQFDYGDKGKPQLRSNPQLLNFNLAHSGGRAIYAFAKGRELGVDLEFMRADLADEQVGARFFSSSEVEQLLSLPKELRKTAFFNCWTRKEAYIKALGEGLSCSLDQFDVAFLPGVTAALLRNRQWPEEVDRWSMYALPATEGFAAALLVEGKPSALRHFEINPGNS